jgi:DNA-binding NarL/FixJ family response regulator
VEVAVETASILIADDHPLLRRGLRSLLEAQPGWRVVGEVSNGRDAKEKAKQLQPDLVLLDIRMPELNGLDAAPLIKKASPASKILFLSVQDDEALVEKALDVGARGYLLKSDAEKELVAGVQAILENRTYFSSAASEVVVERLRGTQRNKPAAPRESRFSMREREIVQLLAEGRSNKEIATRFHSSVRTVEHQRARIMSKLKLHTVAELVRFAIRSKIIAP